MLGHICAQDILKNHFSSCQLVFGVEVLKDVAIIDQVIQHEEETSGMMHFKDGLIIIQESHFSLAFQLEGVVSSWVIHVVSSTRYKSVEHILIIHFTKFSDSALLNEEVETLHDVSGVYLGVIEVLSVGILQLEGHPLILIDIQLRNIVVPILPSVDVHEGEVKQVVTCDIIDMEGIIIEAAEVLVEGNEIWLLRVLVSSIGTLKGQLRLFVHDQGLYEVLVANTEVVLDGLGESSVLLGLVGVVKFHSVLLGVVQKLLAASVSRDAV